MNRPPPPGDPNGPVPSEPWYLRRPSGDDATRHARAQPRPARPAPPQPSRRPPDRPWYLERPDRPAAAPEHSAATPRKGKRPNLTELAPWLLLGAAALAFVIGVAVLIGNVARLGSIGGAVLDVAEVQTGVLQILSDPAGGYGANAVTDVSCNGGRNPSARKGTTFTCAATVNGAPRQIAVLVADDRGTYEVDGPR